MNARQVLILSIAAVVLAIIFLQLKEMDNVRAATMPLDLAGWDENLTYTLDLDTEMCFAIAGVHYGRSHSWVPCTEKVLKRIQKDLNLPSTLIDKLDKKSTKDAMDPSGI